MKALRAPCLAFLLMAGLLFPAQPTAQEATQRFEFTQPQMGVPFRLVFYAEDESSAGKAADAAFARIAQLNLMLSDYDPESELSRLSRTSGSGETTQVSEELWDLLEQSQRLAKETEGAFDVTAGPAVNLWRKARREQQFPREDLLEMVRARIGYRHVQLHPETRSVTLVKPGMRLDLGGIAKGYAVDEAMKILKNHGITRALVAADGDILTSEPPPGRKGWRIALASFEPDSAPFILLRNRAVSTSGDLSQYLEIEGARYSHILDPRTSIGLTNRMLVTVLAPDAVTSDSLATAISVLGPEEGLRLIECRPQTAARILWIENGQTQETTSPALRDLIQTQ
jgi:FAD:protein FMN transferase